MGDDGDDMRESVERNGTEKARVDRRKVENEEGEKYETI